MIRIILFIKRNPFLLPLVFILVVGFQILFMKWQLVDDGKSVQIAVALTDSVKKLDVRSFWNNLLEPDSGRFRPGYWIYLWFTFLIAGVNPLPHYIIHFGLFIITAWIIYRLVIVSGGNRYFAALAATLFVIDWRILENWYRLGPQEPLQTPALLGSLYLFLSYFKNKKKSFLIVSGVLMLFALLSKETNFAFAAIPLYLLIVDLYLQKKDRLKPDLLYLATTVIVSLVVRFIAFKSYPLVGYAALYSISIGSIVSNLHNYLGMIRGSYTPLIEITLVYVVFSCFVSLKNLKFKKFVENYYYPGLFITWFLAFLVIQLPWGFTIGRYLLTAFGGLFIFLSLTWERIIKLINEVIVVGKNKNDLALQFLVQSIKIALVCYLIILGLYQIIMGYSYIIWVRNVSDFNDSFVSTIVSNTPYNGHVYLNAEYQKDEPLEIFSELKWHFDYFYNRKDITLDYISPEYVPNAGDVIVTHTVKPEFSKEVLNLNPKIKFEKNGVADIYTLVLGGPFGIMKEIVNTFKAATSTDKITNNIYVVSHNFYEWVIYKAL